MRLALLADTHSKEMRAMRSRLHQIVVPVIVLAARRLGGRLRRQFERLDHVDDFDHDLHNHHDLGGRDHDDRRVGHDHLGLGGGLRGPRRTRVGGQLQVPRGPRRGLLAGPLGLRNGRCRQGGGAAPAVRPEGPGGDQAGLRDLRERPHEGRLGDRLLQARHDAEPVGAREARRRSRPRSTRPSSRRPASRSRPGRSRTASPPDRRSARQRRGPARLTRAGPRVAQLASERWQLARPRFSR